MPSDSRPDPSAVIGQLLTFSAKLSSVLEDAEPFGGLVGLRPKMRAATFIKLGAELTMLCDEINEQLEALDRAEARKARRLLRHRATRPEPTPTP